MFLQVRAFYPPPNVATCRWSTQSRDSGRRKATHSARKGSQGGVTRAVVSPAGSATRSEAETLAGRAGHASSAVSVVLPCLNEVRAVGACVTEALDAMAAAGYSGEVVVVDNGSSDGSAAAARRAGARVVREERRGYGRALRTGIAHSRGDVVVMADCDGTYDLRNVARLVDPVARGESDVVVGSRLNGTSRHSMPLLHRYVGTPALTLLISQVTGGLRLSDSQSGFRAFRRRDALALGLRSSGMEFASEMLVNASRAGYRITEVPTRYSERIGESKLNTFPDGWRHLRLICLLAPQLLMTLIGVVLFCAGLAVTMAGFIWPSGVSIGSMRWQPVFFGGIALILGVQAFVTGLMLAELGLRDGSGRPGLAFMGASSFHRRCKLAGACAALTGLGLDAFLLIRWLDGVPFSRGMVLAGMAQSLLICGGSIASFAMLANAMARFRLGNNRAEEEVLGTMTSDTTSRSRERGV